MDVTCSRCGTENPPGRKFCGACGAPLAILCSICGASNEPRFRFCGECGSALDSPAGTTPAASPAVVPTVTSELRLVSVLFADLVGFTALSESRDPDEVRDLLSRYFDTCRQLIARYGGTIEKFIGDAVMAVWGTPVAQEDDAERAVRAALDLTEAVAALGAELDAPLQARVGVLTGEAAVTLNARGEGMVAGDVVNTASRIQSAAPPGAVYVGEATRRATEAAVAYADAGPHEFKGKSDPVPLYRALRVVAARRGALRSYGLEAPFVGRERELRLVKELFHASAEQRRAHLLHVSGIAGIGKSRLSWEFYKYIDGLLETVNWHRGRCLAYGEGVTYWALAEMVRGRAGILEAESPADAQAKLSAAVERYVEDLEERTRVEPRLAHLLGLEERVSAEPEELFSAWRLFFERLAEAAPTVLVFEDMQWADPSLLDFVEYLLTWSRTHPLFVIALARPELSERRPDWAAGKRGVTHVYLEPLSPPDMERLLTGLVPGLPRDLLGTIMDRAEGIPLYAVEIVRMLLDRGLLAREGSIYRVTGSVETLDVPETLHALIASRLDGLAPQERSLLQDAAVAGKSFTRSALAAITRRPERELDGMLASLVRKEVLTVQADPRSPQRGQYGFLQDLVRRVAYETLSRRERKARHLAVAAHLEAAWTGEDVEIVEVLASHYVEAYRAAPDAPDAAAMKAKARDALAQAGRRSSSLAAWAHALRYYEQAIELADDPLDVALLHELAGRAAFSSGRIPAIRPHFESAIAAFRESGDARGAARATTQLSYVAFGDGRFDEALAQMEEAYGVLSQEEPDETLAGLVSHMARLLFFRGRSEEAFERLEMALELAETLELPEVLSETLNTKAILLWNRGRRDEGLLLMRHALDLALEHDRPPAAFRAYNNLASLIDGLDRYEDELRLLEEGLELARRYGDRSWQFKCLGVMVGALVQLGRWDEALDRASEVDAADDISLFQGIFLELTPRVFVHVHRGELERAQADLERFGAAQDSEEFQARAGFAANKASVLAGRGMHAEALEWARRGMGIAETLNVDSVSFKQSWILASEVALALGDRDVVEEVLAKVDGLRPGQWTPLLRAQRARFGARLAAIAGEGETARAGFEAAAGELRAIGARFHLAVVLLEHGEWILEGGREDEAEPLLAEAESIFEELKARPWLERLAGLRSVIEPEPGRQRAAPA